MSTEATTEPLTRSEFVDQISEAIALAAPTFDAGATIDIAKAWTAYSADPDKFHRAGPDNESGNAALTFILVPGPWWVSA